MPKPIFEVTSAKIITKTSGSKKLDISMLGTLSVHSSLFDPVMTYSFNFNDTTDIINREKVKAGDEIEVVVKEKDSSSKTFKIVIATVYHNAGSDKVGLFSPVLIKGFDKKTYKILTQKSNICFSSKPKGIDEIVKKFIFPDIQIKSKPQNKLKQFLSHPNETKKRSLNRLLSIAVSQKTKYGNDNIVYQDFFEDGKVFMDSFTNLASKGASGEPLVLDATNIHYKKAVLDYKLNDKTFVDGYKVIRFKNIEAENIAFNPDEKKVEKQKIKTENQDVKKQLGDYISEEPIQKFQVFNDKETLKKTGGEHIVYKNNITLDLLLPGTFKKDVIGLGKVIKIRFPDKYEKKKRESLNGKFLVTHAALHVICDQGLARIKVRLVKL